MRGFCTGSQIAKTVLNDISDQCKKILLDFLPDVWIFVDHYGGDKKANNSGYSLTLKA